MSEIIKRPQTQLVCFEIQGTASLIQNCFSQKSVEQMLRKHMGLSVQRETKKPREVLEAATIRNIKGRVSIPPTAFKKAMLTAAMQVKGLKKTQLRTLLFVEGKSIPITFDEMVPRMDICRTSGMARTPDVRFRPEFTNWKARIVIQFGDLINQATVTDLLQRAGQVGVGEWRPEKDGTFGTFEISRAINKASEVTDVQAECGVPLVSLKIPDWALDADISPELLDRIARGQDDDGEEPEEEESGKKLKRA
jgi:hypothetical protein